MAEPDLAKGKLSWEVQESHSTESLAFLNKDVAVPACIQAAQFPLTN